MITHIRFLIIGFIVLLSAALVVGGNKMAVHAATIENSLNTEAISVAVAAFQDIATLRGEDPVNADAIHEVYTSALQSLVQQIDAANGLALDSDVRGVRCREQSGVDGARHREPSHLRSAGRH